MFIPEGRARRPRILATRRPEMGRAGLSGACPDGDGQMLVASGLEKRYGTRPALERAVRQLRHRRHRRHAAEQHGGRSCAARGPPALGTSRRTRVAGLQGSPLYAVRIRR